VVGTLKIAGSGSPYGGRKNEHRQRKKYASDFKPEDTADAVKGAKKSANATRHAFSDLDRGLTNGAVLGGGWRGGLRGGPVGSYARIQACGGALSGQASGNTQADSQGATKRVRLHSVYDGSSDPRCAASCVLYRWPVADGRHWK